MSIQYQAGQERGKSRAPNQAYPKASRKKEVLFGNDFIRGPALEDVGVHEAEKRLSATQSGQKDLEPLDPWS